MSGMELRFDALHAAREQRRGLLEVVAQPGLVGGTYVKRFARAAAGAIPAHG